MKLEIYGGPKHGGWSGHGEYEPGIDPRLDACPFCDSDEVDVSNTHTPYYNAECQQCGAEGPRNSVGDAWTHSMSKSNVTTLHRQSFARAINDWNMRS
jgi:hypothetical protein